MVLSDQMSRQMPLLKASLQKQQHMTLETVRPEPARLLLLALSILLVLMISFLAARLVFHPLSKIPGPKTAALTHLYQIYHFTIRQDWADTLRRLHEKYGRNEVHINDMEFMYKYTSRRDVAKCEEYYNALEGTIVACTDAQEGMRRHIRALPPLTGKKLLEFSASGLDGMLDELCSRLSLEASTASDAVVNMSHILWAFANDATAALVFGKSLGWLKNQDLKTQHDSKRAFQAFRYTPLLGYVWIRRPWFRLLRTSFVQSLIPGGDILRIGTKLLRNYWTNRSSLHGSKQPGAVTSLGDDYVEAERDTWEFLLAGGELFTTEPSKLLQTLLFRPDCLQKVMEEVWLMSETPGGAPWRGSDVSNMKYMNACIKETIRMGLPEYIRISRKSAEPTVYRNFVIPPQTSICMAIALLANDHVRCGQSDKFIPERWLGDCPEAQEARVQYPCFGFGPRVCVGRELAYHVIAKTVACLLFSFDFGIPQEDGPNSGSPLVLRTFPPRSMPNLKVVVRKRETWNYAT